MTCNIRLRHVLVVAMTVGAVGAWGPVRVGAHAKFVGAPASVAAGSEIALTMDVPHERDDTTFNVAVAIRLPEGWSAVACQPASTWTCTIGTESGLAVVRYDKDPGAAPAEDEIFDLTALAGPTPGAASFPTLQTYNTGETVAWIGDAASEAPAPTLQVVGTAATTTVPTPTSPPPTNPPVTPTVAPTSTAAATSSTSTSVPATTTSEPASTTESTGPEVSLVPTVTEPTGTDSTGGNGGVIAVIVLVLIAAAGSGLYLYLRSRPPTIPPL